VPRIGEWAVLAFWVRESEQGVTSFIDRQAAVAATDYLDEHQIGTKNRDLLRDSGTELFEDSLELNADSLFWSRDLPERFAQRHGYDLITRLPALFAQGMCRYWVPNEEPVPDFELDDGSGSKIRRDYYRLLTDLYISDHLLVLQAWSVSRGMRHKAQVAYGQNLEPIRSNREFVRSGDRAEGESLNSGDRAPMSRDQPTWKFALDWQRCLVGGAHQGGAVRVSTELGAQFQAAFASRSATTSSCSTRSGRPESPSPSFTDSPASRQTRTGRRSPGSGTRLRTAGTTSTSRSGRTGEH
jgi:hypothetical protein